MHKIQTGFMLEIAPCGASRYASRSICETRYALRRVKRSYLISLRSYIEFALANISIGRQPKYRLMQKIQTDFMLEIAPYGASRYASRSICEYAICAAAREKEVSHIAAKLYRICPGKYIDWALAQISTMARCVLWTQKISYGKTVSVLLWPSLMPAMTFMDALCM